MSPLDGGAKAGHQSGNKLMSALVSERELGCASHAEGARRIMALPLVKSAYDLPAFSASSTSRGIESARNCLSQQPARHRRKPASEGYQGSNEQRSIYRAASSFLGFVRHLSAPSVWKLISLHFLAVSVNNGSESDAAATHS